MSNATAGVLNTLEIRVHRYFDGAKVWHSDAPRLYYQEIWVDGQHVDEPHALCLASLVHSLYTFGPSYIWTCGCGNAGCADIHEGVLVRHEPGVVRWRFRRPQSSRGDAATFEEQEAAWQRKARWVEYRFDRAQMVEAIDQALVLLRATPVNSDYSPTGFERQDVDRLDAHDPGSVRWQVSGRTLHVLCDEAQPFFLEGRFIDRAALGLDSSFLERLRDWQERRAQVNHRDLWARSAWLEATRALFLDGYRGGLSGDLHIHLVAHALRPDESLDVWNPRTLSLPRAAAFPQRPLSAPYLCLAAGHYGGYDCWLDETAPAKDHRANFVSWGGTFRCELFVPFELERALITWARRTPGGPKWYPPETFFPLDERALGVLRPFESWDAFHEEGLALAQVLQAVVSERAAVLYERGGAEGIPPQRVVARTGRRV